ncbi:hypothetical protein SAMN05421789_1091 [Kaistella chaponensis]|uniref:Uncharacterized protein n=1 Tax=Kaistella chaponensis TaxID=713588 RepID=A0A1N7MIZ5_9FLAO|nr:hypothetical protein [Kaistella chaponensis]SIS86047.1 hypothetical protein SAMN05421789_1091 [Kaistella chaponensis]
MSKNLFQAIADLANSLSGMGRKTSGKGVADYLNTNNHKTQTGGNYSGKRGTYKTIADAQKHFSKSGDAKTASNIANTLVSKDKNPAWVAKKDRS